MTARAAFRQSDLTKAIKAAKSAGMAVTRCEVTPDGRIVLSESDKEPLNDAFGQWAAKREGRSGRNPPGKA